MDRITDLLAAGSCGINVELIGEVVSVDQILENVLRHGTAADVAVANEKYLNHYIFPPEIASFYPILLTLLNFFKSYSFSENCSKSGKIRQFETKCSSQLVVSLGGCRLLEFLNLLTIEKERGCKIKQSIVFSNIHFPSSIHMYQVYHFYLQLPRLRCIPCLT